MNSSLVSVVVPANAGNYTKGRSGRKIEGIAIHHMAGVLSAKVCGGIFAKAGRNGSSHYGVGKDGEIGQYVNESDTAWTNSNWDSNCKTVTIETSNCSLGGDYPVGDATLTSLIRLVADIAKRNNITLVKGVTLVWHSMYAATECPGNFLRARMDYIIEEANKINNPQPTPVVDPFAGISDEELARRVWAGEFGNGQDRINALGIRYAAVQALVNSGYGKPEPIQPVEISLHVGDSVEIIGTGNGSSNGNSNTAYGIGWERQILQIWTGRAYPYQVGNATGTTGFYKASALRKV